MKKSVKFLTLLLTVAMLVPATVKAQDEFEASVGTDVVSSYIWRGQNLGDASIQPSLSISYKGISLSAWGSVGLNREDTKEFDLTLGYSYDNFSLSLTDYWFTGGADNTNYFQYKNGTPHLYEAQIGYDFGFLSVNWYTNLFGCNYNEAGDKEYSSYISLAAPFTFGGLDWTAELGATPWANDFYGAESFAICDLSLSASKEITVTPDFAIPAFAKVTLSPNANRAYFAFGVSF